MNRPQYFYSTPKGFVDIPFARPVTFNQDPTQSFTTGYNNYVVQFDNDAPQLIRSLFFQGVQQGQDYYPMIQLRDAFGVYLTDGYIPLYLLSWGAGSTPPDGGSGRAKVFEPELLIPPGGIVQIDYFLPEGATVPGLMEWRGVKRFKAGCAR